MAIGIPTFSRMANGNKVEHAARMLSTAFAQARAQAIVTNSRVALVFPNSQNTSVDISYMNSSYGILTLEKDSDTVDIDKNEDFKWQQFPATTIITNVILDSGSITSSSQNFIESTLNLQNGSSSANLTLINIPSSVSSSELFNRDSFDLIKNSTSAVTSLYGIIFEADGTTSDSLYFFVGEGRVVKSGSSYVLESTNPNSSNANQPYNTNCLKLNKFTGKSIFEDLYL